MDIGLPSHERWFVASGTLVGASHIAKNQHSQDSHAWRELPGGTLIAAVSDGAGSRPRSKTGSQLGVDTAMEEMERLAGTEPSSADEWTASMRDIFLTVWSRLSDLADAELARINEFDATLSCAIVTPHIAVLGQIGDGAIVLDLEGDGLVLPIPPENGEYANSTYFITRLTSHKERVHVRAITAPVRGVGMITDGLGDYTLEGPRRTPVPRAAFWDIFFDRMARTIGTEDQSPKIRGLLGSRKIRENYTDDLTLILGVPVTRLPGLDANPAAGDGTAEQARAPGENATSGDVDPAQAGQEAQLPGQDAAAGEDAATASPATGGVEPAAGGVEPAADLPGVLIAEDILPAGLPEPGDADTLYDVPDFPGYCLNLVPATTGTAFERKLEWMVSHPPAAEASDRLIWPASIVRDRAGDLVGWITRRLPGMTLLLPTVIAGDKAAVYRAFGREPFSMRDRHLIAWNLAATLNACHQNGYVIGNLDPSGIFVTEQGHVILTGCERFQVTTPDGEVHAAGAPGSTPGDHDDASSLINSHQDVRALSILVFQLLMDGRYPFHRSEQEPFGDHLYPYDITRTDPDMSPPPDAPALARLHPGIVDMFQQCFANNDDPATRDHSSPDWLQTLMTAVVALEQCQRGHWYSTARAYCLEKGSGLYCAATTTTRPDPVPEEEFDPLTGDYFGDRLTGAPTGPIPVLTGAMDSASGERDFARTWPNGGAPARPLIGERAAPDQHLPVSASNESPEPHPSRPGPAPTGQDRQSGKTWQPKSRKKGRRRRK